MSADVYLLTLDGKLHIKMYTGTYPVIKGFESITGWYWFATEQETIPASDTISGKDEILFFGLVQGFEDELGYFAECELSELIAKGLVWEIKAIDLPYAGRR